MNKQRENRNSANLPPPEHKPPPWSTADSHPRHTEYPWHPLGAEIHHWWDQDSPPRRIFDPGRMAERRRGYYYFADSSCGNQSHLSLKGQDNRVKFSMNDTLNLHRVIWTHFSDKLFINYCSGNVPRFRAENRGETNAEVVDAPPSMDQVELHHRPPHGPGGQRQRPEGGWQRRPLQAVRVKGGADPALSIDPRATPMMAGALPATLKGWGATWRPRWSPSTTSSGGSTAGKRSSSPYGKEDWSLASHALGRKGGVMVWESTPGPRWSPSTTSPVRSTTTRRSGSTYPNRHITISDEDCRLTFSARDREQSFLWDPGVPQPMSRWSPSTTSPGSSTTTRRSGSNPRSQRSIYSSEEWGSTCHTQGKEEASTGRETTPVPRWSPPTTSP